MSNPDGASATLWLLDRCSASDDELERFAGRLGAGEARRACGLARRERRRFFIRCFIGPLLVSY